MDEDDRERIGRERIGCLGAMLCAAWLLASVAVGFFFGAGWGFLAAAAGLFALAALALYGWKGGA